MKVKQEKLKKVELNSICSGDVFSFANRHYIKTIEGKAVDLNDGTVYSLLPDTMVVPYRDAELDLGEPL